MKSIFLKAAAGIIVFMLIVKILILEPLAAIQPNDVPLKQKYSYGKNAMQFEYSNVMKYKYYSNFLEEYEKSNYKPASGTAFSISIDKAKLDDQTKLVTKKNIGGRQQPSLVWNEDIQWIEWEFIILSEGLYQIDIEYYIMPGTANNAVRTLFVDGEIPFLEANNITFYRMWKDESEPIINSLGDETRPGQIEIPMWRKVSLSDSMGHYTEPFKFYFKPGNHTIKLYFIDQEMVIGDIVIKPALVAPTYHELMQKYKSMNIKEADQSISIEFQAENTVVEKNDQTIRRESDGDTSCKPISLGNRKLNVIGGWRWRKGNQSVTWTFSVPEDGLYRINIRLLQVWNDGLPSVRQILIDGEVPFKEMSEYYFVYGKKWRIETLQSPDGEPYLFYLTKGEHTLTIKVVLGRITEVVHSLNDDTILLSEILRDITKITGNNPDPNYDYELMQTIPDLKDNMSILIDSLQKKYNMVKEISDKLPAMANNFLTIKSQLENMIKDPFSIARRINDLNNAMVSLGSWYLDIQNQPLMIDYFLIDSPKDKIVKDKSNFFDRIKATIINFLTSFKKDYDSVGSIIKDTSQVKSVINVWVSQGIEWAELIKELADEDFTPNTGILVNINVLPPGQLNAGAVNALMLSVISGKAPDVALGVMAASPVEFAIRDAVVDLAKFEDFNEVAKRFLPEIMVPFKYNEGVYALPETMNFTAMFYRKDIIEELGIYLPDTREDLYNHVIPTLYQNGMQFYYPLDFSQFIFQHGANFYTPDGKRSALDTPEAYRAFKECSELYTNYAIPVAANFFNRFRTGEMPIGIGNYSLYMQLSVAAPELVGRWGIAPLPGIRKSDGTVDRSVGGLSELCGIIMKQSKNPKDSWEFLKWWTSTPVQARFAREIEAIIGTEARWNTANYEAFASLSWNREDLRVIKEQLKNSREVPVVLGGYFTGRHLNNAWNRVITTGQLVRDAIEEAVEDINRELIMKQEEYGVK